MHVSLRLTAAVALLLGLGGCNMVVSDEPWFTAADAVPTPVLRDGLWLSAAADCRVDEAKPAERWPDCASASFVRGDERWSMQWEFSDGRGGNRRSFAGWEAAEAMQADEILVANGDHLIGQSKDGGVGATTSDDAGGQSDDPAGHYSYYGIRPVRHDETGRVLELVLWPVRCGPLPEPAPSKRSRRSRRGEPDEPEEATSSVTDRPFPGLTVVGNDCVADNIEAVRRAAVLSESLAEPFRLHWVRDGWR